MFKLKLDGMGFGWVIFAWIVTLLVNCAIIGLIVWVAWHFISKYW